MPNQSLCKKCKNNAGLTEEGTVQCRSAARAVAPVVRAPLMRYEDCIYRREEMFGRPVLSSDQLRQLHVEVIALKQVQGAYTLDLISSIEAKIVAGG